MKKMAFAALVAALWTSVGCAGDYWVSVSGAGQLSDKTVTLTYVAVDVSSIVYGPERKAWFTLFRIEGDRLTKMHGMRQAFRCDQRESAITQMVEYDPATLSTKDSKTFPSPLFDSPVPDTMWEEMLEFLCGQHEGQPARKVGGTFYVPSKRTTVAEVSALSLNYARLLKEGKEPVADKP